MPLKNEPDTNVKSMTADKSRRSGIVAVFNVDMNDAAPQHHNMPCTHAAAVLSD